MISVRLRIFFLALVALFSVGAAFFIEYQDIQKKLHATEDTLQTLEDVKALSKLVHSLQKERGLSAGSLLNPDKTLDNFREKQLGITDSLWIELLDSHALLDQKFAEDFPAQLKIVREQLDSDLVSWDELRDFYTSAVQYLLDLMLLNVLSINNLQDISYELQSLSYIANTREKLGLIRATLNRGYQEGQLSENELIYLGHQYGAFINDLRTFEVISNANYQKTTDSQWWAEIRTDVFNSVTAQIDKALNTKSGHISGSAAIWWNDATSVIDNMKKLEDAIFSQIEHNSLTQKQYFKDYLFWYGIFALVVLAAVMLLTAFSVHRILKALSILLRSLDTVEQTQNYGLRIHTEPKDEFGQLSYSINSLLSYTDKLIRDKDLLATTDLLTNIRNRRSFTLVVEKEIQRSERYGAPISLILCDIDFFKSINDNYGHAAGDAVLKEFANIINANLRASDCVGRWGGEEFIVLAADTDLVAAGKLAEKLRQKIMELSVEPVKQVTSSFGVAQFMPGESFAALCERADKALYMAKDTGRNKVCFSE